MEHTVLCTKTLQRVRKPSCALRENHIASCLRASRDTHVAISSVKHQWYSLMAGGVVMTFMRQLITVITKFGR